MVFRMGSLFTSLLIEQLSVGHIERDVSYITTFMLQQFPAGRAGEFFFRESDDYNGGGPPLHCIDPGVIGVDCRRELA